MSASAAHTKNVVLVTLDGVRVEEMFGGLDVEIMKATAKAGTALEEAPLYRKYWAPTPEERREKIMPFFWGTLMRQHGSIAGNRAKASVVQLTNAHRFSYPGYSEILTGQASDLVIKSNAKIQNPFPTVLEFLKDQLQLSANQVAAFCSWDVFDFIVSKKADAVFVNSGFKAFDHPNPEIQALSRLQFETMTPWDSVRHDAYTFRFAMAHVQRYQPSVLYLALGETDDWAHDKRYDRVLYALEQTDNYLKQLWTYLQSRDQYRGKTTIMITTDHGRGLETTDWPNHGATVEGAQYTWIAMVSPDSSLRGEWSNSETIYANQVAATLCRSLGLDYSQQQPRAGKPIERFFTR